MSALFLTSLLVLCAIPPFLMGCPFFHHSPAPAPAPSPSDTSSPSDPSSPSDNSSDSNSSSPSDPSSQASPSASAGDEWCPGASDFVVAYGNGHAEDGGWSVKGGGAVATKATYNLLGGSVEFDIDFSQVEIGINANIYSISPEIQPSGFDNAKDYCDGAGKKPWCVEVDWIETNGNCGGATTLHTKKGHGSDGCTADGCRQSYHFKGQSSFHMKIEHGLDGSWTTIRDGQTIDASVMQPTPGPDAWSVIKSSFESKGALIYSSQWGGWVPVEDCGKAKNDVGGSHFTVKNLRIKGAVVQGPKPRSCSGIPSPSPSPAPATPSQPGNSSSGSSPAGPAPSGQCDCTWADGGKSCGKNDGSVCFKQCCSSGGSSSDAPSPAPAPSTSGQCECAWAAGGKNCGKDDGSTCFKQCCSSGGHSSHAGHSPAPAPSSSSSSSSQCDCKWTHGGKNCGNNDGSTCFKQCCSSDGHASGTSNSAHCNCGWAHGGQTCGSDDGSTCWTVCCKKGGQSLMLQSVMNNFTSIVL